MKFVYVFALGLALTGCSSSQPSPNIRVVEKSLTQQWYKIDHGIASRWVPVETPNPPAREKVIYMDLATTQPATAAKLKPALVQSPKYVSHPAPSRSIAKLPLASRPVPGLMHKPPERPAMSPGKAIVKADPAKPSLQEQQLTMMYAEGDANSAYDLARLLFSQGRSEPAYVALEYAVRQNNPKAIALYSKLRPESGAQL